MNAPIRQICVVVPAHDEEMVVGRCLEALCCAAGAVSLPVTVMVVLDDCGDRTEQICRSFPVAVLSVSARSVGVARHAGITALLSDKRDPPTIWIANTDADSVVPVTWLRDQLDLASSGADVVVGTVGLSDEETLLGRDFRATYSLGVSHGDRHGHVHGANLGCRASAYLGVGGFPPLVVHEDRSLLQRLDASGVAVIRSTRIRVETSARLVGRCEGGFATALRQLSIAS
jgi:cellulose synthase/poly-beta-1,6-N-acetylglucosamine synthase-like glycosyltransferase